MTEQDKITDTVNDEAATEKKETRQLTPSSKQKRPGLAVSAIAIAIIVVMGGGMYYFTQQSNAQLVHDNNQLKQQVSELVEQQNADRQRVDALIATNTELKNHARDYEDQLNRRMQELQAHVTALSSSDVKNWLIAQADFMVKMAGRKLWNDHDPVTAAVLLKSADTSLAEMNDPSLLDIRKAIANDMNRLAAINQIDYDGIILRLNQLSNDVDNLRLADLNNGDAPEDTGTNVSDDIADWKDNLTRSWKSFTSDFITVRARDGSEAPLLAPNQDIYLRENIRSQLLIAAQAVPRYQEETYKQSLEQASTWVRAYFDVDAPATKAFLTELDDLINQPIDADMPETLESQAKLEKVMQTRVRNLLSQIPEPTGVTEDAALEAVKEADKAAKEATAPTDTQTDKPDVTAEAPVTDAANAPEHKG